MPFLVKKINSLIKILKIDLPRFESSFFTNLEFKKYKMYHWKTFFEFSPLLFCSVLEEEHFDVWMSMVK